MRGVSAASRPFLPQHGQPDGLPARAAPSLSEVDTRPQLLALIGPADVVDADPDRSLFRDGEVDFAAGQRRRWRYRRITTFSEDLAG